MLKFRPADWSAWERAIPVSPLDILSYCSLQLVGEPSDIGIFGYSDTFLTPAGPSIPTPEVVGVSIGNTIGSLVSMPVIIEDLVAGASDSPCIIDVDFSSPPDASSISSTTFDVRLGGVPVAGTFTFPVPTKVRFTSSVRFALGTYVVTLFGSGSPVITFSHGTVALDGEPYQLPSGDGSPGGNFVFTFQVLGGSTPVSLAGANVGGWNYSTVGLSAMPYCSALGTDNQLSIAQAAIWNFNHQSANTSSTIPPSLENLIYLKYGAQYLMTLPLNLGSLSYPNIELSLRQNSGTRGDCQGTIPTIAFSSRMYTGSAFLGIALSRLGDYIVGIRMIDSRGNYFMYESDWKIVA